MKTTKPKRTTTKRFKNANQAVEQTAPKGGYKLANDKPGLKEQVKAGLVTAKQALTTLSKKGNDAKYSNTFRWLQKRADKEGRNKEAQVAETTQG